MTDVNWRTLCMLWECRKRELSYWCLFLTISAMAASIHGCGHHSSVSQCLHFLIRHRAQRCAGFRHLPEAESTEKTNGVHWSAVDSRMSWTQRPHDHNQAQSESRVRKKAEVEGGIGKFYTIMLLHLKVEPCTVKLQNNSNCYEKWPNTIDMWDWAFWNIYFFPLNKMAKFKHTWIFE